MLLLFGICYLEFVYLYMAVQAILSPLAFGPREESPGNTEHLTT